MELLKKKIRDVGTVIGDDILKVDSFLNHQIDVEFIDEIGHEFYNRFKDEKITKVLTVETSGISVAFATARYFKVPVVFAKKTESRNIDSNVFESEVFSFTRSKTYKVRISKQHLSSDDCVLIVDDFLASGSATNSMIDIATQAGAKIVGFGIVIEKVFQEGGNKLRESGYKIESLAMIEKFQDGEVVFYEDK